MRSAGPAGRGSTRDVVGRVDMAAVAHGDPAPIASDHCTWSASPTLLFDRSEEHTSELQSLAYLVCRLLLDKATTEIYTLSLHDALPIYSRIKSQKVKPHPRDEERRTGRTRVDARCSGARGYGCRGARRPGADRERSLYLECKPYSPVRQIGRAHV